jgi:hypothetical protein
MKCSKYFGAKWRGFIKSESILAPKGASRFKTQNIRYDITFQKHNLTIICKTSFSFSNQAILATHFQFNLLSETIFHKNVKHKLCFTSSNICNLIKLVV